MSAENPKPLGLATISPASPVRAGAWGTWTIRYVAPASGVDDGGALRIGIRSITDWGRPQLDDPAGDHYLTVSCSNPETRLVAQWRMSGNFRPYAPHLSIEVQDAPLAEGDEIVVTFGDRRGGSCGTRAQTYAQHWFDFRVYVDRFGTGIFDLLVDSPGLTIVPNEPKRLACVATGDGSAAHPVRLLVRAEDEWGNPVNEAVPGRVRLTFRGAAADLPKTIELAHGLWRRNGVRCSGEGVLRIRAEHPALGATECNPLRIAAGESGLHPYWGDLHGQSQETIGTNPAESYFRFARDKSLCDVCAHQGNDLQVTDAFWSAINRLTRKFTREGRFVAFPGYEWSGTTPAGGDHNVIYLDEGAGIFRSSTTQVRGETRQSEDCHPITKLYEALKSQGRPCLLIAHVGGRRANLDFHDPDLDRLVEIHSCWGTFEWLYHDALRRGRRVGVAANSDGHRGRPGSESPGAGHFGVLGGLTCVLAESFTRAAVFEALRARRCYATSGPRIVVDARLDDSVIGSEWKTDSSELPLSGRVHGTAGIERIDLLAAGREIQSWRCDSYTARDSKCIRIRWSGARILNRKRAAEWSGSLTVAGNRIEDVRGFAFDSAGEGIVGWDERGVRWESVTTGDEDGLLLAFERSDRGILEFRTPTASCRVDLVSLREAPFIHSVGGVDQQVVFELAPREEAAPLDLEWKTSVVLRREDALAGAIPLHLRIVQIDGHRAWTSPWFVEV